MTRRAVSFPSPLWGGSARSAGVGVVGLHIRKQRNMTQTLTPAAIVAEARTALSVPELAIVGEGDQSFVYVIENEVARRVPVRTGLRQDGRVEIVSGGTIGAMFVPKWSAALFFGVGSAILSDNPTATSDPGAYGTFENPFVRFGLHLAMTRFPVYEFPLPLFVEVGGWALLGGRVQPFFTVGVGL